MPSRRTYLGAVSAGLLCGLAGCASASQQVNGYVQTKSIGGVLDEAGTRRDVDIVTVDASYAPNEDPPELSHLDDEWADWFPAPRRPVVSEALDDALRGAFDEVRYVVGVTSPGWAEGDAAVGSFNVATTRENFNRVQVHSEVTASSDGTSLTIHSVDGLWAFDDE